jgi:putative transposase
LKERSRRPERSPKQIRQEVVDELLMLKRKHQLLGPEKLVDYLNERHGTRVMATSTAGTILERHGLVKKRRKRNASPGRIEHVPFAVAGAGDSMTADFKGQIRMGNGALCYPLTLVDPFSRYVLDIVALSSTHMQPVIAAFERVFREHGVPRQIITDNGTPFCSAQSFGGLTQLSRRWIELGSRPVRIQPGRPDQNGSHERMHRTLSDWIELHPRKSLRGHQRSFDAFTHEFNTIRSHKALGRRRPVSAYRPYRPYPKTSCIEYDTTIETRLVNANGEIKWSGRAVFLSEVLIGAHVGLVQVGESCWSVHFGPVKLGYLDLLTMRAVNRKPEPSSTASAPNRGSEG